MTASVTPLRLETARVALIRVDETTDERRAEVRVFLQLEGEEHVGVVVGDPAASARASLVAQATLRAVTSLDDEDYHLVDTSTAQSGGAEIALVVVEDPEGVRPLVGTTVIDDDNRQVAYAKAALDAVNRRLSRHT
ncbi:MAG: hypothetical protein A2146_03440 [Actinobacteria bacterium RBG_16_67_10]|jgi:hypothetical protein|nr:MAG: hypothetical protein A2146_03440 [Actinobacteria bacterium RBG_16_67_10]